MLLLPMFMADVKHTDDLQATIERWNELYRTDLTKWAFHKTNDMPMAEDIVQETFMAAVHAFHSFEGRSNPKTWLFSILKNKIMDYFRKKYKMDMVHATESQVLHTDQFFNPNKTWKKEKAPGEWPEEQKELLDDEQFRSVLALCMGRLPALWSTAMQLKYLDQRNGSAICEDLGISQANFWQILHRAKLQLRDCLTNEWFNK
jgi:RNA polymerase sigma-70 factor (TIGR02943 family)